MKIIRIFVLLIIIVAGTAGLRKRYTTNDLANAADPVVPLRQSLISALGFETTPTSGTRSDTDNPTPVVGTVDSTVPTSLPTELHSDFTSGFVDSSILMQLAENNIFHGNERASVALFHFCDYTDSGYCKDFFDDGGIFEYQEILKNNLRYTFQGIPLNSTDTTILVHKAMRCAAQEKNAKKLLSFQNSLYQQQDQISETTLVRIATEIELEEFSECLNNTSIMLPLQQQIRYYKDLFSISTVPTQIIMNMTTGFRIKIPGYYTLEEIRPALLIAEAAQ